MEHGLSSTGSAAVIHRLGGPKARGLFWDQGSKLTPVFGRQILNPWTT